MRIEEECVWGGGLKRGGEGEKVGWQRGAHPI